VLAYNGCPAENERVWRRQNWAVSINRWLSFAVEKQATPQRNENWQTYACPPRIRFVVEFASRWMTPARIWILPGMSLERMMLNRCHRRATINFPQPVREGRHVA